MLAAGRQAWKPQQPHQWLSAGTLGYSTRLHLLWRSSLTTPWKPAAPRLSPPPPSPALTRVLHVNTCALRSASCPTRNRAKRSLHDCVPLLAWSLLLLLLLHAHSKIPDVSSL